MRAETLGSQAFRDTYGVRLAYVAGSMYKGIASRELVVRMGRAGLLGFFGTGGVRSRASRRTSRPSRPRCARARPMG